MIKSPDNHASADHALGDLDSDFKPVVDLLLIGGRSGVGKSTVGAEISAQLVHADVAHAYIEGDLMDWCHPEDQGLFERNLTDVARNYVAAGYRRFVYTNTASVRVADEIARLMPGPSRLSGVLLTCDDVTASERLRGRELGSELDWHLQRTNAVAREFAALKLPRWAIEVRTDGRSVIDIARQVIEWVGWSRGETA